MSNTVQTKRIFIFSTRYKCDMNGDSKQESLLFSKENVKYSDNKTERYTKVADKSAIAEHFADKLKEEVKTYVKSNTAAIQKISEVLNKIKEMEFNGSKKFDNVNDDDDDWKSFLTQSEPFNDEKDYSQIWSKVWTHFLPSYIKSKPDEIKIPELHYNELSVQANEKDRIIALDCLETPKQAGKEKEWIQALINEFKNNDSDEIEWFFLLHDKDFEATAGEIMKVIDEESVKKTYTPDGITDTINLLVYNHTPNAVVQRLLDNNVDEKVGDSIEFLFYKWTFKSKLLEFVDAKFRGNCTNEWEQLKSFYTTHKKLSSVINESNFKGLETIIDKDVILKTLKEL